MLHLLTAAYDSKLPSATWLTMIGLLDKTFQNYIVARVSLSGECSDSVERYWLGRSGLSMPEVVRNYTRKSSNNETHCTLDEAHVVEIIGAVWGDI